MSNNEHQKLNYEKQSLENLCTHTEIANRRPMHTRLLLVLNFFHGGTKNVQGTGVVKVHICVDRISKQIKIT